jgi:osmotically-inducible protein OsmY
MIALQELQRFNSAHTTDERLRRDIESALATFARPASLHVNVNVHDGHVVLRGEVNSYYRKQLAQVAAMSVTGVVSVQNTVVVR